MIGLIILLVLLYIYIGTVTLIGVLKKEGVIEIEELEWQDWMIVVLWPLFLIFFVLQYFIVQFVNKILKEINRKEKEKWVEWNNQ